MFLSKTGYILSVVINNYHWLSFNYRYKRRYYHDYRNYQFFHNILIYRQAPLPSSI